MIGVARGHVYIVLAHPAGDKCYVLGAFENPLNANARYELWAARHAGYVETIPIWVTNGGEYLPRLTDMHELC